MKSRAFCFGVFCVLAACGPLEAPDPKEIAQKLHRHGSACETEVESAISSASWLEELYARNRKGIDELIASKITDDTDSSFSYSNGDDIVEFGVTSGIFGGGYMTELEIRDGSNFYKTHSGWFNSVHSWEVNLNDQFVANQPVSRRHDDTMSEYFVNGDYTCRTPNQAYDIVVRYNFEALLTSKAFQYRAKGIDLTLVANAIEEQESYGYEAEYYAGLACDHEDCKGLARFSETGYEVREFSAGKKVPLVIPEFLAPLFDR